MSSKPAVSFCFTTFKRKAYLQSTLESVSRQTFTDYEVIVSDNDPEGSAREVVEGFNDARFKYFPNEQNLGMKKSFNASLNRSSGIYIVMIADDDPVYPDMLETLMGLKDKYPGYGMYLGGCNWYCTDPKVSRLYHLKVGLNSCLADQPLDTVTAYSPAEFLPRFFDLRIFPSYLWSCAMVEREILVGMGGVPDYGTAFLGDYAYLSIMGSHSGVVVINKALGHQTVHLQNFGRDQNDQLRTAVVNFVQYVSERIKQVDGWPQTEKAMKNFVALWAIGHMHFLHRFYNSAKGEGNIDLRPFEKEVFKVPFVRKRQLKYWLKKNTPALHDLMVAIKRRVSVPVSDTPPEQR